MCEALWKSQPQQRLAQQAAQSDACRVAFSFACGNRFVFFHEKLNLNLLNLPLLRDIDAFMGSRNLRPLWRRCLTTRALSELLSEASKRSREQPDTTHLHWHRTWQNQLQRLFVVRWWNKTARHFQCQWQLLFTEPRRTIAGCFPFEGVGSIAATSGCQQPSGSQVHLRDLEHFAEGFHRPKWSWQKRNAVDHCHSLSFAWHFVGVLPNWRLMIDSSVDCQSGSALGW